MKTDVFVKVVSGTDAVSVMESDVGEAFRMFRDFESRFSRFRSDSELSLLNASSCMRVSETLFSLLERSFRFYRETGGMFDPSILPSLESEGYTGSFGGSGFGIPSGDGVCPRHVFDSIVLDPKTLSVRKPRDLRIDLGGIGKGFIVDRVTEFLGKRYEHCFVYAGGDLAALGRNVEEGYAFWAVDVENPADTSDSAATLLLSGNSVATSGTGRRRWDINGRERHHLIDPRTGKSAETDLVSVTVVGDSVEESEVWSKTLCMLGSADGGRIAEERAIPSIFIGKDGTVTSNRFIRKFLWKK